TPVVVRRGDAEQRFELTLQAADRTTPSANELAWRKLGVRLQTVNAELVSRTNQQLHGGLAVVELRAEGAASKAGIQKGDILVGLDKWEMLNLDNVSFVLTHPDLPNLMPLRFYIIRSGQVHRGWLQQVE
ncbi:MAG TPA: serine protease, partial [Gemmataceae bacterium]|nr:serine protease [Gemmataceae bacterium]